MAIVNGNPVNANYTNAKLVSKEALNQDLIGTYNLKNNSSAEIINVQDKINQNSANIATNANNIQTNAANIQSNLDSINDIIAEIAAGTKKVKSYATDIDYENDNDPLVGGEIYYNATTGSLRYYNFVDSEWKPVGQQILGIQESVGIGDGLTTQFTITNAPLNDEAILVFLNGRLIEKSNYSVNLPLIEFNTAPALGVEVYVWYLSEGSPASPVVASGTPVVLYRTITSGEITAKQLTLPSVPANAAQVMVDAIGGSTGHYGIDYAVSGAIMDWDGLGLEPTLNTNDVLRIFYFT
jgi:hypothetical protein